MKPPRDPYLIKARYAGICSRCKEPIAVGDEALYYPNSKKLECRDCATETLDALQDERMMGGAIRVISTSKNGKTQQVVFKLGDKYFTKHVPATLTPKQIIDIYRSLERTIGK